MHASLTRRVIQFLFITEYDYWKSDSTALHKKKRSCRTACESNFSLYKKNVCTEKKNYLIKGGRRELKVCKRRGEGTCRGGLLTPWPAPPPFPRSKNKILMRRTQLDIVVWHQLSTCCYMGQFWENAEFTRKYERDWVYDKISYRIKLAQNSLYYSTTPPIRPSKENEKWCE